MANQELSPKPLCKDDRITLWIEYEKVTMHFNELIIRLRTQVLGGLAAIVTLGGLAIKLEIADKPHWWVLFVVATFLVGAWGSVVVIDLMYYDKLLRGAVDALLKIESESEGTIYLSTMIERRFGGAGGSTKLSWGRKLFYVPIGLILLTVWAVSLYLALQVP